MKKTTPTLLIAISSTLLSGCANLDYVNANGGRIMHTPGRSDTALLETAHEACAEFDKRAELGESGMSAMGYYTRFDCIEN